MLVRFTMGRVGMAGDLHQFYNVCKLIPEHWNLQRILWKANLDPEADTNEAVVVTLIYGVKSSSCQSEVAMEMLAEDHKLSYPALHLLLVLSRYCDDMGDSKNVVSECKELSNTADEIFSSIGMKCKGWAFSGDLPPEDLSKDGLTLGVGGLRWNPVEDSLQLKIPDLHFSKKKRGRFGEDVVFFDPTTMKIEDFVPAKLTLRMVTSKYAAVYDPLGYIGPVMASSKLLLRETVKATVGWDDPMPSDLRSKWLKEFLLYEQLKGINYTRAKVPSEAVDMKMRILAGGDTAGEVMNIAAYAGFKLRTGGWSCKLIMSKALLCDNSTIPKLELTALCGATNLSRILCLALPDWLSKEDIYYFSDSVIALCWVTSEGRRLSLFHRNRVIQIPEGSLRWRTLTMSKPKKCSVILEQDQER